MSITPNPGSDAARDAGCTCPRMDNHHGAGWHGGNGKSFDDGGVFCVVEGCPLHWAAATATKEDA